MGHPAGASHQKTFTIVTRIPGGFVTPEMLEKIAAVARTYQVPVGEDHLRPALHADRHEGRRPRRDSPGPRAACRGAACILGQVCPGLPWHGCLQIRHPGLDRTWHGDSRRRYQGAVYPAKLKIGVSGCLRCCGESYLRDIGLVGTTKGWTVIFGGNSGRRPSPGAVVAQDLSRADALDLVHRLLEYYKSNARPKERTARFLERIGFAQLKSDLLTLLPYIRLEDVTVIPVFLQYFFSPLAVAGNQMKGI